MLIAVSTIVYTRTFLGVKSAFKEGCLIICCSVDMGWAGRMENCNFQQRLRSLPLSQKFCWVSLSSLCQQLSEMSKLSITQLVFNKPALSYKKDGNL